MRVLWRRDIAFDGYNGGMGTRMVNLKDDNDVSEFCSTTSDLSKPYTGKDFLVFKIPAHIEVEPQLPNPVQWLTTRDTAAVATDPEKIFTVDTQQFQLPNGVKQHVEACLAYTNLTRTFKLLMATDKDAGAAANANETAQAGLLAFQGAMRVVTKTGQLVSEIHGAGHLGNSYVGVAAVRDGKGMCVSGSVALSRLV